ncbi:hypothetical protein OSTOST_17837, partial [Ostertagia ostertagi]
NIEASSIKKFDVEAGITANDIQSAERALLQQIHKGIDCDELQKRFHHQKITRDSEGIIRHAPIEKIKDIPRVTLERQSKNRAYEVIRDFENNLEDTQNTVVSSEANVIDHAISPIHKTRLTQRRPVTNNSVLLPIAVFMAIINLASAHTMPIKCYDGQVIIQPPNNTFNLCFNRECRTFTNTREEMRFNLPVSPVNAKVNVKLSDTTFSQSISCDPPEFCLQSSRILSKSLLGNPHCWPVGAIVSVAIILFIIIVTIMIIYWTLNFVTRSKSRCEPTGMGKRSAESREIEMNVIHSYRPAPLSGRIPMVACVLFMIISLGNSCQHGLSRHHTELVCNQDGKCSYEIGREILFNRLQRKHCIEIHLRNRTVGMLSIEVKAVHFTCVKTSKFFTKNTQHKIFYSHRCSGMGSCIARKCDLLQPNETVPELRRSRPYPGYSACDHSSGGILSGCLLPTPSCVFYRVAHIPITKDVYEVFECQDWSPSIHLEILGNIFGKTTQERYNILPYQGDRREDYECHGSHSADALTLANE